MEALWSARKQALWASLAVRPEGTQIWSTDVAVPISRMADLIGMLIAPLQLQERGNDSEFRYIAEEGKRIGPLHKHLGPRWRRKFPPDAHVRSTKGRPAGICRGLCQYHDG